MWCGMLRDLILRADSRVLLRRRFERANCTGGMGQLCRKEKQRLVNQACTSRCAGWRAVMPLEGSAVRAEWMRSESPMWLDKSLLWSGGRVEAR